VCIGLIFILFIIHIIIYKPKTELKSIEDKNIISVDGNLIFFEGDKNENNI